MDRAKKRSIGDQTQNRRNAKVAVVAELEEEDFCGFCDKGSLFGTMNVGARVQRLVREGGTGLLCDALAHTKGGVD